MNPVLVGVALLTPFPQGSPGEEGRPGEQFSASGAEQVLSVHVAVDRESRVYQGGEEVRISVVCEADGYLYVLHRAASGGFSCLFPSLNQKAGHVRAKQQITIPKPGVRTLTVCPPYGKETIVAVLAREPLPAARFGVRSLTIADPTPLDGESVRRVLAGLSEGVIDAAEHRVEITTVPRRVALLIGIGRYKKGGNVDDLDACRNDVQQMREVMETHGRLDEVIGVLIDEQATLNNIRTAICTKLVERTQPGDEVFIYWSGHGGRCPDDSEDEPDKYDEYLIPHDGVRRETEIRKTMLVDDEFTQWMRLLSDRRVVLILDTCYAGGVVSQEKGDPSTFDFLDPDPAATKNGQRQIAMLCSAEADQVSYTRQQGNLSVMTYFLSEKLRQPDKVTLKDAFEYVKVAVPVYIRETFKEGKRPRHQDPVLINEEFGRQLYLRP